tara:strand:+ start:3769 stop:4170 length:402 start_codon:yes stop_codon:yes gene_type:complete
MSVKCETNTDDWVANQGRLVFTWGLPATLMVITGLIQPAPWLIGVVWASALSWMGFACLINARQCGRMHCFFSGPFFLLGAIMALATAMQWIEAMTFNTLGVFLLIGTPLFCVLPEVFWGTYKDKPGQKKSEP